MWISPNDSIEEDEEEEVVDDPQVVQDIIKQFKSSPNYVPPERRQQVESESRRNYLERIGPFRQKAEELGIVFTTLDVKEILSNKNNLRKYRKIVLLILECFRQHNDPMWQGVFGYLLATPLAGKEGAHLLIKAFPQSRLKWELGSYLEANPDPSVASDLIQILENPEYGMARQRVIVALAKTRDPRAFEVASKLINDPYLTGHAIEALGIVGDPRAVPLIEPHLSHRMPWIRKIAAKVLKRLQPSSAVQ